MLDIFGKEVSRGDIIVCCKSSTIGFNTYLSTKLGVVTNILPKREWKKGGWEYNRVFDRLHNGGSSINTANNIFGTTGSVTSITKRVPSSTDPAYYEVCEKITFHPFGLDFTGISPKMNKDGTPRVRVHLSTNFMIVDKNSLSQEWLEVYDRVCTVFKI